MPPLVLFTLLPILTAAEPREGEYRSPYSVKFSFPVEELIGDLERGPRGDAREESSLPFREWNSPRSRKDYGSWGPPARHYPAVPGMERKSAEWKRERVIATALRYQGYGYQHHHIPDWHPPADWPWQQVASGHNGKGVDCSNFTSFVYNQAFGIKPSSAIKKQAEQEEVAGPGEGQATRVEVIRKPETYAETTKVLKTGDLLYIRNRSGELAHVILWVGPIGQSPKDTPLIIDSHGEGVKDSNGTDIPHGIHLRPFRENSWYFHSMSHAHRIIRGE
jgi:cell wall-associated NlpC family hydrolase